MHSGNWKLRARFAAAKWQGDRFANSGNDFLTASMAIDFREGFAILRLGLAAAARQIQPSFPKALC